MRMQPLCRPENVIQGDRFRITVLTDRLLRFEYQEEGRFEDRASQTVWFRDLGEVSYRVQRAADGIRIITREITVSYDGARFHDAGLSAELWRAPQGCGHTWFYGSAERNLKGTARTLDGADGAIPLEDGVLSQDGFAVLDDAHTVLLTEDGWIAPRRDGAEDFYLFAYGHDYRAAVRDYYRLTGFPPMLPRYALGNWWSRYYPYTQDGYMELMRRFDAEGVPFAVAVIDMDWHIVNRDPAYGDGWTGYTWNREIIPDPEALLSWLHERGMRVTLNVHPAGGVRAFEEAYPEMAEAMGVDPQTKETIAFDIADPAFLRAYLEILHHPLEEQGVDFWWIDWQQGSHTKIPDLDPLWMLNHWHYLDNGRGGQRPMIFSRYAGPGSHRYAVGFSGDSIISWDSLRFQPYFTATAANIGYSWWSHDIGGHMLGEKSDVMQLRWLQFGTFSPILRLHSSNSPFNGKEPWNYRPEVREAMDVFLRLRHQMIPYLYTMNYRTFAEGEPLVRPMYWDDPEDLNAYPEQDWVSEGHPNQYYFGSEMIAAAITEDLIPSVNMGKVQVWLPDGLYHDFFTGMIYRGGRCIDMYRGLSSIPVLVRAGGIVPMTEEIFGKAASQNPALLQVRIYGGADGCFSLYEDDGCTEDYREGICAVTRIRLDWEASEVVIAAAEGHAELIPRERSWTVLVMGAAQSAPTVTADGEPVCAEISYEPMCGCIRIQLPALSVRQEIRIRFPAGLALNDNHERERLQQLLTRAQTDNTAKDRCWQAFLGSEDAASAIVQMRTMGLDDAVWGAAAEILSAARA